MDLFKKAWDLVVKNPKVCRQYTVSGQLYRGKDEDTPAYSYAYQGGWSITLRQALAAVGGIAATSLALSCRKAKKRRQKRAKSKKK